MTMPASFGASSPAATLVAKPKSWFQQGGVSFFYLTSRTAQPMTYQNMRGAGGGGGDESSTTLPNLNYVSAQAFMPFLKNSTISLMGMQSLDRSEDLKIATPFGADFQLPSQIAMLRYRYQLSPAWAADVRGLYIDTIGYKDPSLGVTYTQAGRWMGLYSLSASVPVTGSSHDDDLLTRAFLRTAFTRRADRWAFITSVMHMHSFYEGGQPPNRARGQGRATQTDANGKPIVPIFPSAVDLILLQREIHRTRGDLSVAYALTDRFTVGAGAGLSYSVTEKEKTLWMTSAKPLVLKYVYDQAEIGTEVSLNSDIRDFEAPRLPSILSVGLRVGYTFGEKPLLN